MCLGVPGQVMETRQVDGLSMATVDFGGTRRDVCLAYVPEAKVGDYAIVHVGFALNLLSESEAQATLETLRQIVDFDAAPAEAEAGE